MVLKEYPRDCYRDRALGINLCLPFCISEHRYTRHSTCSRFNRRTFVVLGFHPTDRTPRTSIELLAVSSSSFPNVFFIEPLSFVLFARLLIRSAIKFAVITKRTAPFNDKHFFDTTFIMRRRGKEVGTRNCVVNRTNFPIYFLLSI